VSSIVKILAEPAWQGLGAIIALAGVLATIRWRDHLRLRRRRAPAASSATSAVPARRSRAVPAPRRQAEYFDLTDENREQAYYEQLAASIAEAKETVYRIGRGFHHERRAAVYQALLQAEERALINQVQMVRIQVGGMVAEGWANGYARLLEQYGEHFRMVADYHYAGHNDLAVIDPGGRNPIVNLLFESREPGRFGTVGRPKMGFIIRDADAAADLHHQLNEQARGGERMQPGQVRELARTSMYFGWGVHMSARKMAEDAPGAERKGVAILRDWKRNIDAMVNAPADRATIVPELGAWFDGVAYEMSNWDARRLTLLEGRAYQRVDVNIEVEGRVVKAFTFVPRPSAKNLPVREEGSWIDLVVAGARENEMIDLLDDLRRGGAPVDGDPHPNV
jgi:hypothetical protein